MESKMSFLSNRVSYATIPLSINVETVKAKRWRYLGKLRQQSHVPGLLLPAVRWVFLLRFHPSLNKLYATGIPQSHHSPPFVWKMVIWIRSFQFQMHLILYCAWFWQGNLIQNFRGNIFAKRSNFFLVSVLIRKLQQTSY